MNKRNLTDLIPPWLFLLFIAPVMGELVSAHQSPAEFINPLNFLILSLPYGFGALIARELNVKWGRNILRLLLLGAAFGLYEEGIVVYSLFDPKWNELGALSYYGFYGGINWTWGMMTVHFHIIISIIAGIVITEIVYYNKRSERWLTNRGMAGCFTGLMMWTPVMIVITGRKIPTITLYILCIAIIVMLLIAAKNVKIINIKYKTIRAKKPYAYFILGALNMTLFFVTVFITPELKFPPLIITILILLGIDIGTLFLLLRWSDGGKRWEDRQKLAFVSGELSFFIFFCFAKDFEQWKGTSITGAAAILLLIYISRIIGKRENSPDLQYREGG